jgi:hypothetical protein
MRRLRSLVALGLPLVVCAFSASAGADVFGKAQLASAGFLQEEGLEGVQQQALYAHDPAISGNGQYVVFDAYFSGRAGVWRRELRSEGKSGPVEPVAVGAEIPGSEVCVAHEPCDADLPSVSANGQYVSFTTTAPLTAGDRDAGGSEDHPNVYVRNMDLPESEESAYTLVSAVSGKTEGLSYEGSSADGAIAAGRSAMSANGEEVVFVTTAVSNLAACETGAPAQAACEASSPEAPAASTPALQVAVRNLVTDETRLVSVEYDLATGEAIPDAPVSQMEGSISYGAVYSAEGTSPQFPSGFGRCVDQRGRQHGRVDGNGRPRAGADAGQRNKRRVYRAAVATHSRWPAGSDQARDRRLRTGKPGLHRQRPDRTSRPAVVLVAESLPGPVRCGTGSRHLGRIRRRRRSAAQ